MLRYQVTRAVTRNREQVQILANLYENGKYDFWTPPRIGNVDIMVSEEEIPELEAILREADIPYHVQIQDVGNKKVITAVETLQQFCFFYSGVEKNSGLHGLGFLVSQRARNSLLESETISPCLAKIRLKGRPANIYLLSGYAPTRDALGETKNHFHTELKTVPSAIAAQDYLIVGGNFNARVGPMDQATCKVLCNFGLGQCCENVERLVNYALMNQLTASNTFFQYKPSHLLT
ncbi:hypothetical protein QYM36_000678 [Artemia franciscana]|uniref:Carboxypeptidase activation peptide domain-containing protein n=1 Tax=Artemia franciscana TaxID=6661 RepID=A0AA88LJP7_ARTSF|nr:hypothetical protein QYM36_000678 [Artemia franciscana]